MAVTDNKKERQLLLQAEKILLHPIHPHLISYCPTMDLIAVVTSEENLDVYRINGQRAFGLKRKSDDVTVDALQWEFNGKNIAVSWSDGCTDLVSAETGKVSHKDLMLPVNSKDENSMLDADAPARVKCMGWGLNFIDVETVKSRTGTKRRSNGTTSAQTDAFGNATTEDWDAFKDDTTLEDFLQRQPDFQSLDIAPDLPDQLAMMDTEALLPKLPAIPMPPALPFMRVSVADSGGFSSQAEVDSLLHSHHLKDHNSVDMFIRCSVHGTVHPSIYDSLETVNVHLPGAWNIQSTPLLHASHPYSCTHCILMQTSSAAAPQKKAVALVPMTLNFIPSAGIYLHLIASKTSQLQNLLLYITQTLQRTRTFFKHAQDLPSKFMMNISETLEEKGQGDLVTNLFHVACTGNCPPVMREWLVDELAEQGHKRWDNTVTSSFTTLLALVHENLIPALDRCSIVISRLRGLATFHDRDWIFASPISDFTALLEILQNMRLLAHIVLLYASEEKRQFHAFSKWLRFCIDYEATEPESQSRAEMENRDSGVDIAQVLEYIKHGLTKSNLIPYLKPEAQLDTKRNSTEAASYEDTKKAIELLKDGSTFKAEALCLEHVLGHLNVGVTALLKQVSAWQESNIQMDSGVLLEEIDDTIGEDTVIDMRMVPEPSPTAPDSISTYIAFSSPTSPSTLQIHRLMHTPNTHSLSKDLASHSIATLSFPVAKVLDAKFADDINILVLVQLSTKEDPKTSTTNLLLSLPYTLPSASQQQQQQQVITYTNLSPSTLASSLLPNGSAPPHPAPITLSEEMIDKYTRHVFEGRFTPLKLVVNGMKNRRVVVVLGSDRKHYRVLDLDFRKRRVKGKGKDDAAEDEGSGESSEESSSEEGEMVGGNGNGNGDVEMGGV